MKGIKVTVQQDDNGEYKFGIESLHPFEPINAKFLNIALDVIKENRAKIIGTIDEKFYDKEYFEGKSEKSGLDNFDEHSQSYAMEHAKERIEKLMNLCNLNKESNILELGCAFGHTVDKLRELGYTAFGVDISEYAINKYKKDYKYQIDITQGFRIVNIPATNTSLAIPYWFDIIYGFNLMEHIAELDVRVMIRNLKENLVPNGILFFTIDPVWGADCSHQTIKPREWWDNIFINEGFIIHRVGTEVFKGINGHVYQRR